MQPFPTPEEVAASQKECREAWQLSRLAAGHEKMQLIAKASPHCLDRSEAEGPLIFWWHPREHAFTVSDFGGFITMISEEDLHILVEAIKMEYQQVGAFREFITGKKAQPKKRKVPTKPVRTQKRHISLGDLGL